MIQAALFRQYRVWLPTIWGWIVLFGLFVTTCIFGARNIYGFLAPNDPVRAHILVIEGWLAPEELDQAVQIFKKGGYTKVVTTGGPVLDWTELMQRSDYAGLAADYLVRHGVPQDSILVVSSPASAQERTFLSAVMLRKTVKQSGITLDAINLFSSGPHARRSRLLFQMALGPKVQVGILAAIPQEYDPRVWWQASSGAESVILQSIEYIWVECFFWPGAPGS